MLRSFRVENHKSIRDEAELLLMPAYDKARLVMPVAAIFGANASGKSNLLDALRWMRTAVDGSFGSWKPDAGVPRTPFRLDLDSAAQPSVYCVEALVDGVRHTYGFVVDDDRVREEWLYSYPRNRKRVIFERTGTSWDFGSTARGSQSGVLRSLTRDNALFLSLASRVGMAEAMPMYMWFQNYLTFAMPGLWRVGVEELDRWLGGSPDRHRKLTNLLRIADLGIRGLRIESSNPGPDSSAGQVGGAELSFLHGPHRIPLGLADESQGTHAWLTLLTRVLSALEKGAVLCVDEIDSSLHPRLTARLIELFKNTESNPTDAQLIFTSHDATLLGTSFGQDILARDEIWFVEKGEDGATKLFSLAEFHPRREENTERRYLSGTYGAVPNVSEYEFRQTVRGEPEAA